MPTTSTGRPMPPIITGKAAKALPINMVNTAMPPVKASTAASRLPSGMASGASAPTMSPTPARPNTSPRLASNCGRIIAQPTPSASRRPSCTAAPTGGRSQTSRVATAMTAPRPRLISVTCLGSTRPATIGNSHVPASATPGTIRAGKNKRLPWRARLACRSASLLVAGWPLPGAPASARATSASTIRPLAKSLKPSPARNSKAIKAQKPKPRNRALCWRSSKVAIAQPPNTSPASA